MARPESYKVFNEIGRTKKATAAAGSRKQLLWLAMHEHDEPMEEIDYDMNMQNVQMLADMHEQGRDEYEDNSTELHLHIDPEEDDHYSHCYHWHNAKLYGW